CVITAASVSIAAASTAQPGHTDARDVDSGESSPPLQGWGKPVHRTSSDVGVWAAEGQSALKVLSAAPGESSARSHERLELGPIKVVTVVVQGKAHDVVSNAATVGEL